MKRYSMEALTCGGSFSVRFVPREDEGGVWYHCHAVDEKVRKLKAENSELVYAITNLKNELEILRKSSRARIYEGMGKDSNELRLEVEHLAAEIPVLKSSEPWLPKPGQVVMMRDDESRRWSTRFFKKMTSSVEREGEFIWFCSDDLPWFQCRPLNSEERGEG